jgi:uncharacterized membrane protein YphA (DoxX/SURF4 family)
LGLNTSNIYGALGRYIESIPRLTLGIVFLAWGIDKFINMGRYIAWISVSWRIRLFIPFFIDIESFVLLLGFIEVLVGLLMFIGLFVKRVSMIVFIMLIFFLVGAGPPMSYPQDIGLMGVSLWLMYRGGDILSMDYRMGRVSVGRSR